MKLTPQQMSVLSNTICGDIDTVLQLEQMGYVTNVEIKSKLREEKIEDLAFFDLTELGEKLFKNSQIMHQEIIPRMREIADLCQKHNFPYVQCIQYNIDTEQEKMAHYMSYWAGKNPMSIIVQDLCSVLFYYVNGRLPKKDHDDI